MADSDSVVIEAWSPQPASIRELSWADTVDQYLSAGPRDTMGTDRDPGWAEGLPDGQERLAVAFQRVRNLTHHQWWQAVGVRMSRAGGRQVNEWFWAPLPVARRAAGGRRGTRTRRSKSA